MATEQLTSPGISRRHFMACAARAGVGGLAVVGLGALGGGRRDMASARPTGAPEVHVEAREITWQLAPGKTIKAMAYNGRIPGPEIRVREGERVWVVLKNALTEPTTIHWHGVDVPNAMDGVPGVTQKPVPPGETFIYEFDARLAGTRWYHTHFQEHRQMDLGLVAPLIIEPAGWDPFPFDREYTLVLDDWATGTGSALPPTREGTAGGRGGMGGMMSGTRGAMGGMDSSMMGGRGMGGMMRGGNAHDVPYDGDDDQREGIPGHRTAPRAEGRARPAPVH
jgi:multicopper oxidase